MIPQPNAVSLSQRIVLLDDGTTLPFANMISADGEETDDIQEAVVIIAEGPHDRWYTVNLRDYEPVATN